MLALHPAGPSPRPQAAVPPIPPPAAAAAGADPGEPLRHHQPRPSLTPSAEPAPARISASAPDPVPAPGAPAPATPPPTTPGPRNLLESSDGTLRVAVGSYTDCSGVAPVSRTVASLDPCFLGRYYFVGHNPGVFSPLMRMGVGDQITYHDARGRSLAFRVVAVRLMVRNSGQLALGPGVAAQFQTCEVVNGSSVRVLDAVYATA